MNQRDAPIGVFDSGVGGLSVLREIRRELPSEDLLYVADSAFAPYGDQPADVIKQRAFHIALFFQSRHAKAIVVACNTATGVAVDDLRRHVNLPIVATEPAVKPAAAQTRSGTVGVLATAHTLASPRFSKLVDAHAGGVRVLVQPCPGLVERIEAGEMTSESTRTLLEQFVRPLLREGADALVLGCTHYPFVADTIREIAGPDVRVIDPAVAVARELRRRLADMDLLAPEGKRGHERFLTSGSSDTARPVIGALWGGTVEVEEI